MPTGTQLIDLARNHIGEQYRNVLVPKNNPNWTGPWDCAEFASWLVYQTGGFLYGCVDNNGDPATTEAYTGAWKRNSQSLGQRIPWTDAAAIKGAMLLRYPPAPGRMGHIAVSDGNGGTVEAHSRRQGVKAARVSGRLWHTGVLIPGFSYDNPGPIPNFRVPTGLYGMGESGMNAVVTKRIQFALRDKGIDPGPIDGIFGPNTTAAVLAYQRIRGLVADGIVGPQTARSLGISLR